MHIYVYFSTFFYQLGIFSSLKVLVSSNLIYFCFEKTNGRTEIEFHFICTSFYKQTSLNFNYLRVTTSKHFPLVYGRLASQPEWKHKLILIFCSALSLLLFTPLVNYVA